MNGRDRHEDERRRHGSRGPGGPAPERGHGRGHDVGQRRGGGATWAGAGPQRGFEDPSTDTGRYASRPYASRSPDYNFDPRGGREYGYSSARGSMVSPGWDHWREDDGPAASRGGFGAGEHAAPSPGREQAAGYAGADFGRYGPRYAGADYGRGAQEPGRSRFDGDDLGTDQRTGQWQGHRGAFGSEPHGPYPGDSLDEGRSGSRSSWGASRQQLGRGTSFRGHGPQGYVRSDERLLELICERLTDDPDIDPREVRVQVAGGEVTLEGRVGDRWMKHHIEDMVDACAGVTEIHNRIRVGEASPLERKEPDAGAGDGAPDRKATH